MSSTKTIGININNHLSRTSSIETNPQLKLGLSPSLKLTGLHSNQLLANKQLKSDETKKIYEEGLMNILKCFHKEYMKQNQIAIHKMIISENVVDINTTVEGKN